MSSQAALLSATIRTLLGALGESQADLGRTTGLSAVSINRKLTNKYPWNVSELESMATHWGLEIADLFQGPSCAVQKVFGAPKQRTPAGAA